MIDTGILIVIIAFSMTIFVVMKACEAHGEGWTAGKAVVLAIMGMVTAYTYTVAWNTITDLLQTFL